MLRKSRWDSGLKEEGVNDWFYKFFAVFLLQLVALSGVEGAVASGAGDTDITASILKIDKSSKENSDLIWAGLSDPAVDAGLAAPKEKPGILGISKGGADDTEPEKIKLAKQHTDDKPATAVGAKGSDPAVSLSRMEPLRLRRAQSIKKQTILRPWLRALMVNFRWGGILFDQYSTTFGEDSSTVTSNSYGASVKVSSITYIWQPWFALLGGGIGTTAARIDNNNSSSTTIANTGDVILKVFPTSRFPFMATYSRRRTDADSGLSESGIGIDTLKLSQQYISRKNTLYSLNYYRTTTSIDTAISGIPDESTKIDVNERLDFNVTRNFEKHRMRLTGILEKFYNANTLNVSKASNLVARDNFSTEKGVLINALANYNETESTSHFADGKKSDLAGEFAQFSGNAIYTTKSGKMNFNGNVRLQRRSDERKDIEVTGSTTEQTRTLASGAVRAGFRYALNRNTSAYGSADASRELETDDPRPRYNQNLNLSYGADPLEMGKFSYRWNSSAGLANSISPEGEATTADGRIGHTLGRPLYSGKNTTLTSDFSQNYTLSQYIRDTTKSDLPADHSISNNASVGGINRSGRRHINARLTISDFRAGKAFESFGQSASQVINLLVNLNFKISPVELIEGLFISQYASRQASGSPDEDSRSSSASVSYRNSSLFDIRRLTFVSTVRISEAAAIPYSGDDEESKKFLWDNRLELIVGRLRTSALVKWEETNGVGQGTAFIRVTRSFGSGR